jgi:signal transduction histidine kinase
VQKIRRHIFLVLSVLSFVLALLFFWVFERGALGASEEKYLSNIKDRVKTELGISERDLIQVLDVVSKNLDLTFTKLRYPAKYPYYVFKNDSLMFWSDHRFAPEMAALKNVTQTQVVDFENSKFIVSRRQYRVQQDTIDVFSTLNLYRYYQNEDKYLQSGYNTDLFPIEPEEISSKMSLPHRNVMDDKSRFLFSIIPPKLEAFHNQTTPVNTLLWGGLAVLFLGIYVFQWVHRLARQKYVEPSLLLLAVYLLALRGAMLYYGVPFLFIDTDLFNSKFYASSLASPSLGDLLLNCFFVLIFVGYLVDSYFRSKGYFYLIKASSTVKAIAAVMVVALSFWVFGLGFSELTNIYEKSLFTLDITLSISFSLLKIASLIVFIILASIYFLSTHLLVSLFVRLSPKRWQGWWLFVAGAVIGLGIIWFVKGIFDAIFVVHAIYFLTLYLYRFPRALYSFRYRTTIYYFAGAFLWAIVTTYVVYHEEDKKDIIKKKEFGEQIIAENDGLVEVLLDKANKSIMRDTDIQNTFLTDTILSRERIQQKIKSIHLERFFDKYDIEVYSFKVSGAPLDNLPSDVYFEEYVKPYRQAKFKTDYEGIYFINDLVNNFKKQYVSVVDIQRDSSLLGRVVLNLLPRQSQGMDISPASLIDKKLSEAPETRQYSYAIYDARRSLIYRYGSYNYERKMPKETLNNTLLFQQGLSMFDYKHIGSKDKNGRAVIVSSKFLPIGNLLSNFSFLFLILVLYVIFIVGLYALRYGRSKLNISYAAKIQIMLNVAFFAPLILLVVIILSVINNNYYTSQENAYLATTKNVVTNAIPFIEEYARGGRSQGALEEELSKIARDAKIDVNFFNKSGYLTATTKPFDYESRQLSRQLNPNAYIHLLQERENEILLNESLGEQQYHTAYVSVRASNNSEPLGVLSVPFFDSKPELDRQIIDLISSILSVFAIIFIAFLVLSYWASNHLTVPLSDMTKRFRRINLYKLNEPVEWKSSEDEIGVLVNSYNQMLKKLEESKEELAKNEKQTAWREMAKQVAHEIKNPLTPMKLTIQQLQRTMSRDLPQSDRIKRTFESLIDQIDNISDIATSFSDFAKMPMPKNELFEIASVLNKAADLYADDSKITLTRHIQNDQVNVVGDRQLLGRIITNLIINGIQSVPADRHPEIYLGLRTDDANVYIEVKDNGKGIPEGIRSKVFFPNFSTKQGGSGLGLAIAKRGVEHAGGTIWFETEEGQGTAFFLSLPIAHEPES